MRKEVLLAAGVIMSSAVAAQASLVLTDGNFDASGSFAPYWTPTSPGATVSIDTSYPYSAPNDAAFTGGNATTMATLDQTLTGLLPDNVYTVDFYMASGDSGVGTTNQLNVVVSGGAFGSFGQTNVTTQPYSEEEFSFYAVSTSATFEFQGFDATGTLYVDNVIAAVPEPTCMSLLVLGSLGILSRRQRKTDQN